MGILPVNEATAWRINMSIVVVLFLSGMLHPDPTLWYKCYFECFFGATAFLLGTAVVFQGVARLGTLIQSSPSAQPTRSLDEIKDTLRGFSSVVSGLLAWPMARAAVGLPTAMRPSLSDCVPTWPEQSYYTMLALYWAKAILGILAADVYNYWKHRLFHTQALWNFHRSHHSHHNPSALAGYAISPAFGLATFWPLVLFGMPELGLYGPIHGPILLFYLLLNHYLHCGYVLEPLEKVTTATIHTYYLLIFQILAPLYIMSSRWHNVHHEKGRMGFDYKVFTYRFAPIINEKIIFTRTKHSAKC
jgi:sterol desaturase/sphingolipid hydroxylase (fatty acid hydroxylase superfamily)